MQCVLITGAGSGFGEALSHGFARQGFNVVATMRKPEQARKELLAIADCVELDVTSQSSRRSALDEILGRHSGIDVLINNAGISFFGALEDTPEGVLRQIFETNFFGPVELSRLVLPLMRERRRGRIINITAIGAVLCTPFLGAYCASKHALDAATAAMDVEVRPFGVRALSILPAQFRTSIGDKSPKGTNSQAYSELGARLGEGMRERAEAGLTDLSPVVEAALHAAAASDPRPRYVVGEGSASMLDAVIPELESLKAIEDQRAGFS